MAWSEKRYEELVEILNSTKRKPDVYPDEIKAYNDLAEYAAVEREAGGHKYNLFIRQAKNRTEGSPLYIYLHGGGWAVGHAECDDYYSGMMADQIRGTVIDVDYTTSFSADISVMNAQVRDTVEYAVENAAAFGCSPDRIVIGGFSAGGHLTAGVLLQLLEEGRCPFAGVILAYAPLDLRFKAPQAPATPRDEAMQVRGAAYEELALRGNDALRYDHIVSPLLASKQILAKLPRMMVLSAQLCEFKEQDETFAEMISRIGIETTTCRFTHSAHGFIPHFRQEWQKALPVITRFIKSC